MNKYIFAVLIALVMALPCFGQLQVNIAPEDFGYQAPVTADTTDTIKFTFKPIIGMRPVILGGIVRCADSSAHKIYYMTPTKRTTLYKAMVASADTFYTTDSCPDAGGAAPAAGDIYVIQKNDGTFSTVTCSVYTTGKLIAFKHGEASTVVSSAGKYVWAMGAPGDANCQVTRMTINSSNAIPSSIIIGAFSGPIVVRIPAIPIGGTAAARPDSVRFMTCGYVPK